ncbi:MAG: TetR/AcrR family transcriptional regulator [Pseudomonadota bacterium]
MPEKALSDGRHLRRDQTRQKLVGAAKSVMAQTPAEAVTVDQITRNAKVGRGSFYNHFSSMDELFVCTLEELISDIGESFATGRQHFDDIAEFAAWSIQLMIERAVADPQLGWFIVNNTKSEPVLKAQIDTHVRAAIEAGMRAGRFQISDSELWFTLGTASTTAFIRGCLEGRLTVSQRAELAATILQAAGLPRREALDVVARSTFNPTDTGSFNT